MNARTRTFIHKRLDRIKESCEEALDCIEKADQEGDDNTDYFALEDAADYFHRITEEVEEATGQWWA